MCAGVFLLLFDPPSLCYVATHCSHLPFPPFLYSITYLSPFLLLSPSLSPFFPPPSISLFFFITFPSPSSFSLSPILLLSPFHHIRVSLSFLIDFVISSFSHFIYSTSSITLLSCLRSALCHFLLLCFFCLFFRASHFSNIYFPSSSLHLIACPHPFLHSFCFTFNFSSFSFSFTPSSPCFNSFNALFSFFVLFPFYLSIVSSSLPFFSSRYLSQVFSLHPLSTLIYLPSSFPSLHPFSPTVSLLFILAASPAQNARPLASPPWPCCFPASPATTAPQIPSTTAPSPPRVSIGTLILVPSLHVHRSVPLAKILILFIYFFPSVCHFPSILVPSTHLLPNLCSNLCPRYPSLVLSPCSSPVLLMIFTLVVILLSALSTQSPRWV